MDSSEKKNMSHFKSTSQSITNSRRSISNSRNLLNRDRTISQSISNSREKMISTSHSSINAQTMTNSPGITSRNRSRTISNSPSVMNSLNRTISSNMTHRARSRTIGTQPAENEQEKTPIGGMVQLIGLLHHSLKEQQQRSIDRMEKLESLLLEERQQRQQAEHKKDLTMKKFEHMYQQLQDHIEATKEDLSTSPPPSYQSLLMERVSSSLSGLERSMERHQLKKQSTPPVSISNQRRMAALRQ
jgi:hypothetical protein